MVATGPVEPKVPKHQRLHLNRTTRPEIPSLWLWVTGSLLIDLALHKKMIYIQTHASTGPPPPGLRRSFQAVKQNTMHFLTGSKICL
jgi:hypothetical protein